MDKPATDFTDAIRDRYGSRASAILEQGASASCCGDTSCCGDAPTGKNVFSEGLYLADELDGVPLSAALATLGCGNPTAVAQLNEGDVVLDLGSGAGLDVIISARRVGPTGHAYGIDMTDEMLALARKNAAEAGVDNVTFLKGDIENVPLDDASIDVIISNCVVNLAADKPQVLREMRRILRPGGRIAVSDVVIEGGLPDDSPVTDVVRNDPVAWGACLGGALSDAEYIRLLEDAGFVDVELEVVRRHTTAELFGSNPPQWTQQVPQDELERVMARFTSAFVRGVNPS